MNHARATAAPIIANLGGHKRSLRRLSRRDFGVVIERMPDGPDKLYRTPYDAHRWAGTAEGAVVVIALASLEKGYTPEQLDARLAEVGDEESGAWGSIVQQVTAASTVTAESLLSGEEQPAKEGEHRPDPTTTGTISTKPA